MSIIRNSLTWKLILAFLVVAIATAGLMALYIRLTSADRLTQLIIDQQRNNLESSLAEYYSETGSWNNVVKNWQQIRIRAVGASVVPTNVANPNNDFPGRLNDRSGGRQRSFLFGLADQQGVVLVPVNQDAPAGTHLSEAALKSGTPITVNGQDVGTILTANVTPRLNPEENLFLQRTTEAVLLAVVSAMLVALIIAILLARTLIHPLHALTSAAQKIAQGQLEQEVKVTSKDEIGRLAESFNLMSREVARVNNLRRKMTADIAHDLRTPLTVIAGYVESMRDGVLQPTPQRLTLIYSEIERLQNLVDDLKMLSLADAGELPLHPQVVDPETMLESVAATFQHRAEQQGISIEVDAAPDVPAVKVDEQRMMQVFGNLVSNSLRYTPEEGKIRLTARSTDGRVEITVEDTGSGIDEEEIPLIFDRFHRADKSRHTENGESGLGLAIVKALVEAQSGVVGAESKIGEGTKITMSFPAAYQAAFKTEPIVE